ncbi:MAG: ABC transporter permease [Chloroflexi bacterium]|nr:ABC transporter permease [Chloroflexota bacterium]MCL5075257.1 ABC transporter permease [Chloroflexota bacterium]
MFQYLIRRVLHSLLVVLGVSMIVFTLLYLTGDPAPLMLPMEATVQDIAEFRHRMGFDRPLYEQYFLFLSRVVHGDFGNSLRHGQPALQLVLDRLPATLELTLAALFISLLIAIPAGIISALKKDSVYDAGAMLMALTGQCMPSFWLGILLILIFAVGLRLLPASGRGGIDHLILPAITLGMATAAVKTRLLRSSLLEVLSKDYVRTARAKGLAEKVVLLRHALKNAAIPVVTVIGLQMGTLMGGAIITETVFAYPGMGLLAIQAIRNRDIPVVQAFVMVIAVVIILMNLLVDLFYTYLDPRVKYT